MKKTKSDWRSCLKKESLTDLMVIQLEAPDISEFDPLPAVKKWHSMTKRRPTYERNPQSDDEETVDCEEEMITMSRDQLKCLLERKLAEEEEEMEVEVEHDEDEDDDDE